MAVTTLQAYLLGTMDLAETLRLQARLVQDAAERGTSSVLLCEHDNVLTVGRAGSRAHWPMEVATNKQAAPQVRWLNRGGGCWLQMPGQLCLYTAIPFQSLSLTLPEYVTRLRKVLLDACRSLELNVPVIAKDTTIWLGDRPVACLGVAVQRWVAYYGAMLNVHPRLEPYRHVKTGVGHPPMTSLQRESRKPLRVAMVREALLDQFARAFGYVDVHPFSEHHLLTRRAPRDAAVATR